MRGAACKLRNLLSGGTQNLVFSSLAIASYSTAVRAVDRILPASMTANVPKLSASHFQSFSINYPRNHSLQGILSGTEFREAVLIDTVEQFNEHFRKIQDELLPVIFYFTHLAARGSLIKGMVVGVSNTLKEYPNARVYKINIAKESLEFILSNLGVPRPFLTYLHFYKNLHKDSSKVVQIETEEQYDELLQKIKCEKLAAIFYLTDTSIYPFRLGCPIIERLSEKYPNVTVYKIDVDKETFDTDAFEGIARPSLVFYINGERVGKLKGSHNIIKKLQDAMVAYDCER